MKKEAYYLSHDCNARHDPKIVAMKQKYGLAGYGLFWVIIEMLRESADYKLPMKGYIFSALSEEIKSEFFTADNFVQDCIQEFELFVSDSIFFWSESLLKRMKFYDEERKKKSNAGRLGGKACQARLKQPASSAKAVLESAKALKESKIKETKENQNKEKERKAPAYSPEFLQFWENHPRPDDKGRTWINWCNLLKEGFTPEQLMKTAENYKLWLKQEKRTDQQYYKTSANFLGEARTFESHLQPPVVKDELDDYPYPIWVPPPKGD